MFKRFKSICVSALFLSSILSYSSLTGGVASNTKYDNNKLDNNYNYSYSRKMQEYEVGNNGNYSYQNDAKRDGKRSRVRCKSGDRGRKGHCGFRGRHGMRKEMHNLRRQIDDWYENGKQAGGLSGDIKSKFIEKYDEIKQRRSDRKGGRRARHRGDFHKQLDDIRMKLINGEILNALEASMYKKFMENRHEMHRKHHGRHHHRGGHLHRGGHRENGHRYHHGRHHREDGHKYHNGRHRHGRGYEHRNKIRNLRNLEQQGVDLTVEEQELLDRRRGKRYVHKDQ